MHSTGDILYRKVETLSFKTDAFIQNIGIATLNFILNEKWHIEMSVFPVYNSNVIAYNYYNNGAYLHRICLYKYVQEATFIYL